jgi:hypothetical protein
VRAPQRVGERLPATGRHTLANLVAVGLDVPTLADDILMKGERPEWEPKKLSRRQEVARRYRIVLNIRRRPRGLPAGRASVIGRGA